MADAFRMGRHDAEIGVLMARTAKIEADVAWIKDALAEQRGGRRVALWVASAGGGVLVTVAGVVLKKFGL